MTSLTADSPLINQELETKIKELEAKISELQVFNAKQKEIQENLQKSVHFRNLAQVLFTTLDRRLKKFKPYKETAEDSNQVSVEDQQKISETDASKTLLPLVHQKAKELTNYGLFIEVLLNNNGCWLRGLKFSQKTEELVELKSLLMVKGLIVKEKEEGLVWILRKLSKTIKIQAKKAKKPKKRVLKPKFSSDSPKQAVVEESE